jgi:hypothetical protein
MAYFLLGYPWQEGTPWAFAYWLLTTMPTLE